jgi:UDP:flavonoid glycosyltransferase YjiC (YdhE family)
MRVLIPTIGSRGDVQPFIALAQGLERAGHTVTLLSHHAMRPLVEAHAVNFAPMGPDVDMAEEAAAIRQRSGNMLAALFRVMNLAFDILAQCHEDILVACQDADLVVIPASSAAGKNEAELLDLPTLSVDFMSWTIAADDPRRSLLKRVAYASINKLVTPMTARPLNKLRRQQGLSPVGPEGFRSARLNLVPISPLVYAPNPNWAPINHVVGYWFVEEPPDWQPPAELSVFLDAGPPPLVVNLGAMSAGDAVETSTLFVEAIEAAGQRAIVQGWGEVMKHLSRPTTIYAADSLPHGWLLPRAAGLVHHGGFGTTAAGCRAGIPQLVVPHMADQFYWGQRVKELGVGPPAIGRSKLSNGKLAAALGDLAHSAELHAAASQLGQEIQAEHGVETAVRLIGETFGEAGG